MNEKRKIELLSPAKNLECGVAAITCGADAVYIGSPKFSARFAAGNSVEDVQRLCDFAHLYGAKVYVALNTILTDEELKETESLIHTLYKIGVDALIVQDMGILMLDLPPIALHASTQMNNRTLEKVQFLEKVGFSQVVLARELSQEQIASVYKSTNVLLECFIHGALCVSYSGQCYLSEAMCGRSANRGQCAQYCRHAYDLLDANGKTIIQDKHLLSLRDFNLSNHLESLIDAGASSLKIEGRLKEVDYVKNVTAFYRQKLDEIFARRSDLQKASFGKSEYDFIPKLEKSFNRGFTSYFFTGKREKMASFLTPKSIGEPIGKVLAVKEKSLLIDTQEVLNNGDGFCVIDNFDHIIGFRINKAVGNEVFPADRVKVGKGGMVYRNFDQNFNNAVNHSNISRKLAVSIKFFETEAGFNLNLICENGLSCSQSVVMSKELAQKPQKENIIKQLSRLGSTIFYPQKVEIETSNDWFIPSSILSKLRQDAIEKLIELIGNQKVDCRNKDLKPTQYMKLTTDYSDNIHNEKSAEFYRSCGVESIQPSFEKMPVKGAKVMTCKYCLLYELGKCRKNGKSFVEPLYLQTGNKKLRLDFDCKKCEMSIIV